MVMMDGGNDGGLAHGVEFGFFSIWALCHIFRFKTILTLEIQSYQEYFMKHRNCIPTIQIATQQFGEGMLLWDARCGEKHLENNQTL